MWRGGQCLDGVGIWIAGQCQARCGAVRQARVVGMRHLFRLHLSRPLHQLSLPRDSPLDPHGEAQESQTGARCRSSVSAVSVLCDGKHTHRVVQRPTDLLAFAPALAQKPSFLDAGERTAWSRRVSHVGCACCRASAPAQWGSLCSRPSYPPRLCQWDPAQPASHGEGILGWACPWRTPI